MLWTLGCEQIHQRAPLEEMHGMDRVREEVEAFNKACDLPDSPDDDEDEDEGFEDDQLFCD